MNADQGTSEPPTQAPVATSHLLDDVDKIDQKIELIRQLLIYGFYDETRVIKRIQACCLLQMPIEELNRILAKIEHDDEPERTQSEKVRMLLCDITQLPLIFFQRSAKKKKLASEAGIEDEEETAEQPGNKSKQKEEDNATRKNAGEKCRAQAQADQAIKRDGRACVITGRAHPQACHIFPFEGNNDIAKLHRLDTVLVAVYSCFFRDRHHLASYRHLFVDSQACSDKAWNIISLEPELHIFWGRPYFGLRCIDLDTTSELNHDTLTLEFRWVPWFHANDKDFWNQPIPLSDLKNEFDRFTQEIEELAKIEADDFPLQVDEPVINSRLERSEHERGENVKSGHTFKIRLPKASEGERANKDEQQSKRVKLIPALTDGEKMKKAIDLQWAMVVLCSMAGGAGYSDDDIDSDSDDDEEIAARLEDVSD